MTTLPGPCYPDWPDMSANAMKTHLLDPETDQCAQCEMWWPRECTCGLAETGMAYGYVGDCPDHKRYHPYANPGLE